jgi:subtilisin family serine protease
LERVNALSGSDLVDWASPNFYQNWQKFYIPNDPRIGFQWHLRNIGQSGGLVDADSDVTEAWDVNRGGSQNIVIAVIDDGVQSTHPDLNIWTNPGETAGDGIDNDNNGWVDDIHGWNFVFNTNQTEPQNSDAHGTAVGGVAAARGDNGLGVAGAAYNSQLISIKMFDDINVASDANIAAALRYAVGMNRAGNGTWDAGDLVNNSWGGGLESAVINSALVAGTTTGRNGLGGTYLFATGNGFAATLSEPAAQAANIPGVIAVGATNNRGTRSDYSNYGVGLDFVTPSDDSRTGYLAIDTTDRTGADGYEAGDYTGNGTGASGGAGFGGTSSATPLASGITALALAQADALGISINPVDLRSMMRNNTDLIGGATYSINTGRNDEYGYVGSMRTRY